jgi:hypothetical protein
MPNRKSPTLSRIVMGTSSNRISAKQARKPKGGSSRKRRRHPSVPNKHDTKVQPKNYSSQNTKGRRSLKGFAHWWIQPMGAFTIAVIGIALGTAFWWWPHSSSTSQFKSTAGGENPAAFFNGSTSAQVAATQLILFSKVSAAKNASVDNSGPTVFKTTCHKSVVIGLPGTYQCVLVTPDGNPVGIDDPCIGIDSHDVICAEGSGYLVKLHVSAPSSLLIYKAEVSAIGQRWPWRLKLANGMTCSWDWWDNHGQRWLCTKSEGGVILLPELDGRLVGAGDNPLRFTQIFVLESKSGLYYASNLTQGQQSTWTILLESDANPGDYQHVAITQAWY